MQLMAMLQSACMTYTRQQISALPVITVTQMTPYGHCKTHYWHTTCASDAALQLWSCASLEVLHPKLSTESAVMPHVLLPGCQK